MITATFSQPFKSYPMVHHCKIEPPRVVFSEIARKSAEMRLKEICDRERFNFLRIIGQRRDRKTFHQRAILSRRLISEGYGFAEVGRAMRKDHTSIIHQVKRAKELGLR